MAACAKFIAYRRAFGFDLLFVKGETCLQTENMALFHSTWVGIKESLFT